MRAVFENRNLCIDVIGSFLNSKELGRLLCTCKKLYSFSPSYFTTIRDCWWQFGDPVDGTIEGWLEHCTRANDTQALDFLSVDEVLPQYLAERHGHFRRAFGSVLGGIVTYSAKYGTIETLQWAIARHSYLMRTIDERALLFSHLSQTHIVVASILDGSDDCALYLLKRFEDALFPKSDPGQYLQFSALLYTNSLTKGRCKALFDCARAIYEKNFFSRPGILYDILESAESPRYLDFLREREKEVDAGRCLGAAFKNPNTVIFEYVMRNFPVSQIEPHHDIYKEHYVKCKSELQRAIVHLQQGGPASKNWIEAIARIQERIASMELYYARYFYQKWPRMIPQNPDCQRWLKKTKL